MTNTLWAETFVDELARGGLQAVVIAPGSRSTPLTLAFAAHPAIRHYLHLDERSAAFFALGLALATTRPVALLCTSGTAGANYFPAIIEARMSQVPLLVLTSDRPPELRHSGANQTIDQVKLYGDQVLWGVDVALPEADAPAVALRNLRTLAARALATAAGLPPGPVHLNFPFRKPLEPALPHTPAFAPAGPPHTRTLRVSTSATPLLALIGPPRRPPSNPPPSNPPPSSPLLTPQPSPPPPPAWPTPAARRGAPATSGCGRRTRRTPGAAAVARHG